MCNKYVKRTIKAAFFTFLFSLTNCAGNNKSNMTIKHKKSIHFNKKDYFTVCGYSRKINNIQEIIPKDINNLIYNYYYDIDPKKFICIKTLKGHKCVINSVVYSPSGKYIASCKLGQKCHNLGC